MPRERAEKTFCTSTGLSFETYKVASVDDRLIRRLRTAFDAACRELDGPVARLQETAPEVGIE